MFVIFIILLKVYATATVKLDYVDCGVDETTYVGEGNVGITKYPWLGILYYPYWGGTGETRATTTVALIHKEFVIGAAAEIGPMPKHNFRRKTRVLLGENWDRPGRRVRNYILHPEYGETFNTVALVQLRDIVRDLNIRPLCPPPNSMLKSPTFYVTKFKEDYQTLEKEVLQVLHIPGKMCKDFYVAANLYSQMMRPPHVACAVSILRSEMCVWNAGSTLLTRDIWGRWQLLGVGVRGPGCGAPSRYLDMMSYIPWVEQALSKFRRLTISKMNNQKYVLRSSGEASQRFGACDDEEKLNVIFREYISLRTDNNAFQYLRYNLTLIDTVEFSCLTLALVNATAESEMSIRHYCGREAYGKPCYYYRYSAFEIMVDIMFADTCTFEMVAWGYHRNLTLLDMQTWKWHEGSHYEDFAAAYVEYRGPTYQTDFGYEPLDIGMWVPEYDIWTTTIWSDKTTETTPPMYLPDIAMVKTTTKKPLPPKKKPKFKPGRGYPTGIP